MLLLMPQKDLEGGMLVIGLLTENQGGSRVSVYRILGRELDVHVGNPSKEFGSIDAAYIHLLHIMTLGHETSKHTPHYLSGLRRLAVERRKGNSD